MHGNDKHFYRKNNSRKDFGNKWQEDDNLSAPSAKYNVEVICEDKLSKYTSVHDSVVLGVDNENRENTLDFINFRINKNILIQNIFVGVIMMVEFELFGINA